TADGTVTLTRKTGTGTLGGTLTGTITSGSSAVTISGVTYTKAETGVVLTATGTGAGSNVAAKVGDSNAFTVVAGAADAAISTLTPTSASIVADGSTTQVLTVTAKDANGNNLTAGGAT
ncbi:invasin domain 3-containing protein, partial [Aquirufa sp. OSTEICH-129A]